MYTCPVCGYPELDKEPKDFVICPLCLTQFGYDDTTHDYEWLRRKLIKEVRMSEQDGASYVVIVGDVKSYDCESWVVGPVTYEEADRLANRLGSNWCIHPLCDEQTYLEEREEA